MHILRMMGRTPTGSVCVCVCARACTHPLTHAHTHARMHVRTPTYDVLYFALRYMIIARRLARTRYYVITAHHVTPHQVTSHLGMVHSVVLVVIPLKVRCPFCRRAATMGEVIVPTTRRIETPRGQTTFAQAHLHAGGSLC